jgi:hypothetical protein
MKTAGSGRHFGLPIADCRLQIEEMFPPAVEGTTGRFLVTTGNLNSAICNLKSEYSVCFNSPAGAVDESIWRERRVVRTSLYYTSPLSPVVAPAF